jgi:Rrf2 family nitric oxide-sensitive transcriptional repressor
MRLTLYTDYALRVLMQAALRQPEPVTINEVATAYGVSRNHLVKVVQDLAQHGFLITRRGIGGGFTLGLPAETISVGDVVRFTETDDHVIDCANRNNEACRIAPVCRLKGVLAEAAAAFFQVLDRYTVADLVKRETEMKKLLGMSL